MIPRDYQESLSDKALQILRDNGLVYLSWEERTGKSLTAILVAEKSTAINVLIITKKGKPLEGWQQLLKDYDHNKTYLATNYHQVKNLPDIKWDLIILDEAHNYISGYPKPSTLWGQIKGITKGIPLIYLSATPHAQGLQLLYHQFALCTWSPWANYSNFYNWFRTYGVQKQIKLYDKWVNQYTEVNERLIKVCIDHLFITKTRKELKFNHEPKDVKHYIELSDKTKKVYNQLLNKRVLKLGTNAKIIGDTTIKLRTSLHALEGGAAKIASYKPLKSNDCMEIVQVDKQKIYEGTIYNSHIVLCNYEKIDFILNKWGDTKDIVIMYNYIAEGYKLREVFKKAEVLQATSNAEGVELTHIEHLIVYSQDFSTARHTQRRARQASKHRDTPIFVHYLLVKKGVSEQVYSTVSINKQNYIDSRFKKEKLE